MKKDFIIVNIGNITIILENNDGFPVERKEAYLKLICGMIKSVDEGQLWDVFVMMLVKVVKELTGEK